MNRPPKDVRLVPAAKPEPVAILDVISRAASDPAVDVDKLDRLLQMHERLAARDAEAAFNIALNACQTETGRVSADATNPQTRSRYATYARLDFILRPIYTAHGFSLSFDEGDSPQAEHVRVLCHVSHKGGHTRTYHKDMPADGKGAKGGDVMTKTHAVGAAQSYGMRYLLKGIFNIAIGEDDDDGNEGEAPKYITEKQCADLEALLTETGADKPAFRKYFKITSLDQILASNFDSVCAMVRERGKRR